MRACGATSKCYLRLGNFDDFKFGNCIFLVFFSKNDQLCLVENSDQLLIKYPRIGSRVRRNQTTVMWICDCWMQEGKTDRRGRSHPLQCTTSRENRQIVRMTVTDHSVISRTVAQPIESVTHHSVHARTLRRCLQQSGLSTRLSLLGLPLKQNYRRLRRQ
ncbi:transposable element Tcb1 transposase [Trichonephila clavipes]|uniref:Transposable element Tcb1 transposase n=1 Tax=Trichonephila clavipes TaxID=2585209 RepID=A0A8X6R187_TRICX|nr:transposable element Tcb1 transposase [Trichonephila clavipes]